MEPAHETFKDFIGVADVARQLRKRTNTIVRLIESGDLPAVKNDAGEYVVRQVDVDAFARAEHEERLERASDELGLPTKGDTDGK